MLEDLDALCRAFYFRYEISFNGEDYRVEARQIALGSQDILIGVEVSDTCLKTAIDQLVGEIPRRWQEDQWPQRVRAHEESPPPAMEVPGVRTDFI